MDYLVSTILFILNLRLAAKGWEKNEKPLFEGNAYKQTTQVGLGFLSAHICARRMLLFH